jgi:hypothetical protein
MYEEAGHALPVNLCCGAALLNHDDKDPFFYLINGGKNWYCFVAYSEKEQALYLGAAI